MSPTTSTKPTKAAVLHGQATWLGPQVLRHRSSNLSRLNEWLASWKKRVEARSQLSTQQLLPTKFQTRSSRSITFQANRVYVKQIVSAKMCLLRLCRRIGRSGDWRGSTATRCRTRRLLNIFWFSWFYRVRSRRWAATDHGQQQNKCNRSTHNQDP